MRDNLAEDVLAFCKLFNIDPNRVYFRRYSMVICKAGHHLTGEGEPPTECPICKGKSV